MNLQKLKAAAREKYVLHVLSGELAGKEGDYLLSPAEFDEIVTSTYLQAVEDCGEAFLGTQKQYHLSCDLQVDAPLRPILPPKQFWQIIKSEVLQSLKQADHD